MLGRYPSGESGILNPLENVGTEMRTQRVLGDKLCIPQPPSKVDSPQNLYQLVRKAWDQDRMEELLAMIEENDDVLLGQTRAEARVRFDRKIEEYLRRPKEKRARESEETP